MIEYVAPSQEDRTTILVVDDNIDEIAEFCDVIDSLGHHVKGAESVRSALHVIENDRSVKIVITDIRMEGLDGFDLLAEIDARYGRTRPIAKIVASGFAEYDYAVEAMRHGAIDIIQKPCTASSIKAAIRRACILQGQLPNGRSDVGEPVFDYGTHFAGSGRRGARLLLTKELEKQRSLRSDIFESKSFSDPAWDIFLDLCAATFANQKVSVSSVCAATDAPFSTALRYVNRLVDENLAVRLNDPHDKRRNMLELSELGLTRMETFLAEVEKMNVSAARMLLANEDGQVEA